MKLAFSTNAYLRHPFDEAAERIASFGYEGLELLARSATGEALTWPLVPANSQSCLPVAGS